MGKVVKIGKAVKNLVGFVLELAKYEILEGFGRSLGCARDTWR